jgi:hypothetical protein
MITIIGTNFGSDTDKRIWLEPSSPSDAQWIGPSVPEPKFVSENSIRLDLPKNALEAGKKYFVRVESKGMLTDRRIKEDVDAAIKVTA